MGSNKAGRSCLVDLSIYNLTMILVTGKKQPRVLREPHFGIGKGTTN